MQVRDHQFEGDILTNVVEVSSRVTPMEPINKAGRKKKPKPYRLLK